MSDSSFLTDTSPTALQDFTRRSLFFPAVALAVVAAGFPSVSCFAGEAASDGIHWKCSTEGSAWVEMPRISTCFKTPEPVKGAERVFVDSTQRLQAIDGWGGCFNERGWKAMESLSPKDREAVMRSLFDPKDGLKLNFCRTPIGASDYGISLYSLDEMPGDYGMEHFSIERDKERLIPFIKAAMAIRPGLKLWAVPWSPPSWMKDNNNLVGGKIKDDAKTLGALGLYFARYLQAYKAEGVPVSMVMPQNEPSITSNYTSCQWTGAQLAKFIGYHLGPELEREGLATKIFLGTIQDTKRGGYAYWVAPSLEDQQVRQYVAGIGCQWDALGTMRETHFLFPKAKLMQSEAECGKTNANDWHFGEYQFQLARKWFGAGASSNMVWNLVLDETGKSTADWAQCSPVVVNSQTHEVAYTPYYYCYKHFSYFVQPRACLVAAESSLPEVVPFVNPDGEVVVVVDNPETTERSVCLNLDETHSTAPVVLPPHSFNTFTLAARKR